MSYHTIILLFNFICHIMLYHTMSCAKVQHLATIASGDHTKCFVFDNKLVRYKIIQHIFSQLFMLFLAILIAQYVRIFKQYYCNKMKRRSLADESIQQKINVALSRNPSFSHAQLLLSQIINHSSTHSTVQKHIRPLFSLKQTMLSTVHSILII